MIYIIIPAYNEAKNLPRVVKDIATVLRTGYEIIIVNDGSADNTLAIAQQLKSEFPITVLDHQRNKGVAEAFRTGITHVVNHAAPADVVIVMEGDGTSSPSLVPQMIDRIRGGADIVIASRYRRGGKYKQFPLKRLILSRGANYIFQLLVPVKNVRDYSIFYRAYRASVLQQALRAMGQKFITVQTFFANIEILLHLRPYIGRVEEIPFVYDYGKKQGKSGMKVMKNLQSYLAFLAKYVLSGK